MQTAGYVLAGGASSRMGRNKAFLMLDGLPLVEIAARTVREAAGSVTLIGPPEVYAPLGYRVIPDRRTGCGPLAGIETALTDTTADWNLLVACDMPRLVPGALRRILEVALDSDLPKSAACVLPESRDGRAEPLCAAYHRSMLPIIGKALDGGVRKVTQALPVDLIHYIRMTNEPIFQNINTPEDWRTALER